MEIWVNGYCFSERVEVTQITQWGYFLSERVELLRSLNEGIFFRSGLSYSDHSMSVFFRSGLSYSDHAMRVFFFRSGLSYSMRVFFRSGLSYWDHSMRVFFFRAGWVTPITQWGYLFGAGWVTQITQWGYFFRSGLRYSDNSVRVFFRSRLSYWDTQWGYFFGAGWVTQITQWGYLNLQHVKWYSLHKSEIKWCPIGDFQSGTCSVSEMFPRLPQGSNPGPLVPEASALTSRLLLLTQDRSECTPQEFQLLLQKKNHINKIKVALTVWCDCQCRLQKNGVSFVPRASKPPSEQCVKLSQDRNSLNYMNTQVYWLCWQSLSLPPFLSAAYLWYSDVLNRFGHVFVIVQSWLDKNCISHSLVSSLYYNRPRT